MTNDVDSRARRRLLALFASGVVLGLMWERLQFPFYVHEGGSTLVWSHVSFAAIADGILLLLIYLVGWLRTRDDRWHRHPGAAGYTTIVVTGTVFALLSEILGLFVVRRWSYAPAMPLVPGIHIGVLPLLGMVIVPLVALRIVAFSIDRTRPGAIVGDQ